MEKTFLHCSEVFLCWKKSRLTGPFWRWRCEWRWRTKSSHVHFGVLIWVRYQLVFSYDILIFNTPHLIFLPPTAYHIVRNWSGWFHHLATSHLLQPSLSISARRERWLTMRKTYFFLPPPAALLWEKWIFKNVPKHRILNYFHVLPPLQNFRWLWAK